ncbi:MAG: S58 family peptidase [Candidatus Latescibacteria bacterium]|nr:S58 family peptidase [Candidatus Latescibacterota bacterium]NIO00979.1 S58 family peptidase [Candidatus Latescibacterota bacterium]NIO27378.1 S58 family peptidase [Candidatus Latescibacterota bacterium]NIO54900.1 S58 family peptidase [Candidatus Latescibacterota bacterium]NIT00989.1 S58 family peptidase [Candidatus Latescibacterota bacterium]
MNLLAIALVYLCLPLSPEKAMHDKNNDRPRCRNVGITPGILQPGKWNAITDVQGVRVGSVTVWKNDDVRTGVTVVIPHEGNVFREKVPAGVYVGNGFGKAMGFLQVDELGNLETPIALTNTLNVGLAADALISSVIEQRGNEDVFSVNAVVGETNDGFLNDIRKRSVTQVHVFDALKKASSGPVEEGSVGAGTGTRCFGFKGGIGTASRVLPESRGGYTVGALVQANFGGVLTIDGVPVGQELGQYYMKNDVEPQEEGSCMIIVATDAPVSPRNLKRMAKRAMFGLVRTGGFASNGSGDFVVTFSTAKENRIPHASKDPTQKSTLTRNDQMSPLFLATVEAVEEAIYNALFRATTVCGFKGRCVEALPIERVKEIYRKYR